MPYAQPRTRIPGSQTETVSRINYCWQTMNAMERGRFLSLTAQLFAAPGNGLPPGANAFNTFAMLSHARLQTGRDLTPQCPPLVLAPPLPLLKLTATWTNAGVSLQLGLDPAAVQEEYPCAVSVWGARPILAHQALAASTKFKSVGYVNAQTLGPVPFDVTPLYLTRYRVASPGLRVALRVVGVTADGFSSAEQFVWADVDAG